MNRNIAIAVLVLIVAGCDRRPEAIAPPAVRFGQTDCAQCGMSVADERYAAALVVRNADGEQVGQAFDDIGCMVEYERDHHDVTVLARYVKDFQTHQWVAAERAAYVHDAAIASPMGFGVLATAAPEAAAGAVPAPLARPIDLPTLQAQLAKPAAGPMAGANDQHRP